MTNFNCEVHVSPTAKFSSDCTVGILCRGVIFTFFLRLSRIHEKLGRKNL